MIRHSEQWKLVSISRITNDLEFSRSRFIKHQQLIDEELMRLLKRILREGLF